MVNMEREFERAKVYYEILKRKVNETNLNKKSLAELCKELEGHNFNNNKFNANLGSICVTISENKAKGKIEISKYAEIFLKDEIVYEDYKME